MESAIGDAGQRHLAGTEHLHGNWVLIDDYPLSPQLLAMSRVWQSPDRQDRLVAAKGAPEAIMDLCHFDAAQHAPVARHVEAMASEGLRVLAVARAIFPSGSLPDAQHDFDFEFIGLVALEDPVRPDVPAAIGECRAAGIRVVMITGDHPQTALSIARQASLVADGHALTGTELDQLDDAGLAARLADTHVFCRIQPEQKLRLVQAFRARGDVVAMTGDGVNDAPALKAAHIGVAMGARGTDVAREAAGPCPAQRRLRIPGNRRALWTSGFRQSAQGHRIRRRGAPADRRPVDRAIGARLAHDADAGAHPVPATDHRSGLLHRVRGRAAGDRLNAHGFGGDVATRLSNGGFDDPNAESTLARDRLLDSLGTGSPNVVLLVTADDGTVNDPAVAAAGQALTDELAAEPGVTEVASYWSLGSPPPLANAGGTRALVLGRIVGTDDEVRERIKTLSPAFTRDGGGISVEVTGQAEVFRQVGSTIEDDLKTAEMIALPITLLLLIFIFGSVVAALLPLAIGIFSVFSTFLVLRILTDITDVSIFALNLTTALGLGLAIDYSLFIVSRYREELAAGYDTRAAVIRSVRTAGRTVAFSSVTVAISLAALLVFPQFFLRSFAYAGIAVAIAAAVGSVVVLPALLAVLGPRIDSWRVFPHRPAAVGTGAWHSIATKVMKRPVVVTVVVLAVLLFLGSPFLGLKLATSDHRVLPEDTSSRTAQETIAAEFSSMEAGALEVVTGEAAPVDDAAVSSYAVELSRLADVARVDARTGSFIDGVLVAPPNAASARFGSADGAATWWSVVPDVEPTSPEAEELVKAVRGVDAPAAVMVAGISAGQVDGKDAIFSRLPLAGGIIAIVTFTVLFMMLGSIIVPLKALVLNVLSLSATFGAMVWIFQEGHLSGVLGFTATGTIDLSMPILMFCIAFGLSMDYEVFLLSRIKEEHDLGRDTVGSVAIGLERTGRLVTAAATLISVVFFAFATSGITFIKLFGIGLALAVLLDAFVIRGTLVPAFMRLAGEANWWAPRPLAALYARFGFSEHAVLDDDEPVVTPRRAGRAVRAMRAADAMPDTSDASAFVSLPPMANGEHRGTVDGEVTAP